MSRNNFAYHNWGGGAATTSIYWVDARDAIKHPAMYHTDLTQKTVWSKVTMLKRLRNSAVYFCWFIVRQFPTSRDDIKTT